MPVPDRSDPDPSLTERIRELETLLGRQKQQARKPPGGVPILDDVVEPGDDAEDESAIPRQADLDLLVDRIEQRLAGELEELVDVFRSIVKEHVVREVRSHLGRDGPDTDHNATDEPDLHDGR